MTAEELLSQDFGTLADVIRAHAVEQAGKPALVDARRTLTYGELDALMDRVAAALQRDGVGKAEVVAVCATTSVEYAAVFLGILRAAAIVAPLAPSSTPESLVIQLKDSGAKVFFLDAQLAKHMAGVMDEVEAIRVSTTDWAEMAISTGSGKSTRRNTMPVSGGAGRSVISTR